MEYCIGDIILLAVTYPINEFFECRGQSIDIRTNQALYSFLGTKFGGDGATYFKLPDLSGSAPHPELKYYICYQGIYPSRN